MPRMYQCPTQELRSFCKGLPHTAAMTQRGATLNSNPSKSILWYPFFYVLLFAALSGCAAFNVDPERRETDIDLSNFITLKSLYPGTILANYYDKKAKFFVVFIESDGKPFGSWPSNRPALPQVERSVALSLSTTLNNTNILYFSRPCQFIAGGPSAQHPRCDDPSLWTKRRYGPEQLELIEDALISLLPESDIKVALIGHSGGGVVALNIALRQKINVSCVITLAAPIDLTGWLDRYGATISEESVDPFDLYHRNHKLNAVLVFGSQDRLVPLQTAGRWEKVAQRDPMISLHEIQASHSTGWSNALTLPHVTRCLARTGIRAS